MVTIIWYIKVNYKVGDRVRSSLSGEYEEQRSFTGVVVYTAKYSEYLVVDIKRDDKKQGSGVGQSWNTLVSDRNRHLMSKLLKDWDD